ncbi:tRNA pseudouridine32 synthase / 23S rRNA pseudouridine746 synthase [Sphingomonas laterariae]|uniref:tRNA pseudouridine32 synthase / 23S rRNA pseudouridine746 synthase n=1 Tax=Edaphosphingomonas laterariae TaxID=861865 RepID=A0A239FSB1_9SPHN|nr:RNA pseudouridine synthase [Sphingomonas laterariae]SNS59811.1 tRNA pseudouridine32 synthase / 23S rRNA pseudouridine746 synthase [Sphingomonas laterariae]
MLSDRVLFIDAEALVVDKPAGLPVTEVRDGSLSVENHLDSLRFGFQRRPAIVHRLDRDTSGCLLLARNPKALKRYSAAFEAGEVAKTYWAVVSPVPAGDGGTIDLPLHKVSTREAGWRMIVDPRGKASRTHWRKLAEADGRALIEFTPETGRTHQIRVHAASGLNAPIVGDPVYGKGDGPMLLHARALSLPRPNKAPIEATAEPPASFGRFAAHARLADAPA